MKLTIEDLAVQVNKKLENLSSKDKRFSNELSARRIRDYLSKGLLDKPFKDGKNIYFTELHVQKLTALREVQSEGVSEENVKKFMLSQSRDENDNCHNENAYIYKNYPEVEMQNLQSLTPKDLKKDAFNAINEIANVSVSSNSVRSAKVNTLGQNVSSVLNFLSGNNAVVTNGSKDNLSYINKPISKTWVEIPLTNSGRSFFRMEEKISFSVQEKEEILQNIKYILGIKGE